MNFHSDEWIMNKLNEHYQEALTLFPENRIVGIFLQGSQNYGLDYEGSDIDTKLIVVPTFEEIAFNSKPHSTTHIRENDEHIDIKDIRLMLQTFRKENVNFIEILFTKYKIINPTYADFWQKLVDANEKIARASQYAAVKAIKGVALEKYFAMEHRYPSRAAWLDKFGYDPKQLHHLMRIKDFLIRYVAGEKYANILIPLETDYLKEVKIGKHSLEEARELANECKEDIEKIADFATQQYKNEFEQDMNDLLDFVQLSIMRKAIELELH